jgi:hypothetical protein
VSGATNDSDSDARREQKAEKGAQAKGGKCAAWHALAEDVAAAAAAAAARRRLLDALLAVAVVDAALLLV